MSGNAYYSTSPGTPPSSPWYAERLCLTCARAIGLRGVYISESACYCRRCAEYVRTAIENALREG